MPLIELIGVSKDFGGEAVLEGIDFSIEEGEKIGLIGRNGAGKTSLLRIIEGTDDDFRGVLRRRKESTVALVPQRFEPPKGPTCVELLLEGPRRMAERLERLEGEMAESCDEARLSEYGDLRARYEAMGGDDAEEASRRVLDRAGLGASADTLADSLSGGEKSVLALAMAMAQAPDLLLLDEPGNHLDFAGLEWLESFVSGERRAILLVSHNRSLLDATASRIVELDAGRLGCYPGGYSAYRLEKLRRAAGQGKDWQADRKRVERLEALVRRFAEIAASRPDPAWGKRLRARRSQLERERGRAAERPAVPEARMSVRFDAAPAKSDYALIVRGYRKAFDARLLLENAGFDLMTGERAAIVGPNGCGKTSFLRDLVAAEGRWDEGGSIRVGPSMRLGYCAQASEPFAGTRSVAEEFRSLGATEEEAGRILRRFLFDRSILGRAVSSLSGGERNRLQIARAVFRGANFLVLDEPTDHLDIESREALEEGLADFAGTVLVVSHDRWFLEKVASRLILVQGNCFSPYEGSFAEYWRDAGRAAPPRSGGRRQDLDGRARAIRVRAERQGGDSGEPASARLSELESRITSLEKRKEELERASASAAASRDFRGAGRAAEEAATAARSLDRLYSEWERAAR